MDLSSVSIEMYAGKITNTSTAMEYSLDSTDGNDGSWIDASNSDTSVLLSTFVGTIFVREKNDPTNVRLVAESPKAPSVTAAYSTKLVGLPLNASNLEARISSDGGITWMGGWTNISTNSNGETSWGTPVGYITQVRVKATSNTLTGYSAQQSGISVP